MIQVPFATHSYILSHYLVGGGSVAGPSFGRYYLPDVSCAVSASLPKRENTSGDLVITAVSLCSGLQRDWKETMYQNLYMKDESWGESPCTLFTLCNREADLNLTQSPVTRITRLEMQDPKYPKLSPRTLGSNAPCVGLKGCVVWCFLQPFLASSSAAFLIQRSLGTTKRHGSTAELGGLLALKITLNKEGNDSKFSHSRKYQHDK